MKQLLKEIIQRLADAAAPGIGKNGRLFAYVDIDWGQVDFYTGWPPPVKFRAALVDILRNEPTDTAGNAQTDVVEIQVRIIDMILTGSSAQAPEKQREMAFAALDAAQAANALLHGWTPFGSPKKDIEPLSEGEFGPLTRTGMNKINRSDGLREFRLTYRVQVPGYDAVRQPKTAPAAPRIKVSIVKPE